MSFKFLSGLLLILLCACEQENFPDGVISTQTETNEIIFSSKNSSQTLTTSSNYPVFIENNADWINLDKNEGSIGDNIFNITVSENNTKDERVSYLTVLSPESPNAEKLVITIRQAEILQITSFRLEKALNSKLSRDVECSIKGDEITAWLPELSEYTEFIPTFTGSFTEVKVDNVLQISNETSQNFEDEKRYTITNKIGEDKTYRVKIYIYTAIPILKISTEDKTPIVDKTYRDGEIAIYKTPDFISKSLVDQPMKIKGRGNATLNYPKKPYKIKLDTKSEILDIPSAKEWVLLAEYTDKSLMRNTYGFEFAKLLDFSYYSKSQHVEVFYNEEYMGTYLLTEQVEAGENRINIDNDGYIIEQDGYWYSEPISFCTPKDIHYTFKYPDTDDMTIDSPDYTFIQKFMTNMEDALFSDDFKDEDNGYRKYLDVVSMAKWLILQEVLGNIDTNFYYTLKNQNSKLQAGPIWDLEWSLGLAGLDGWWASPPFKSPIDCFYHINRPYFSRLLEDPYFVALLKDEWSNTKEIQIPELLDHIDETALKMKYAQSLNFIKWNILGKYVSVGLVAFDTWDEEVNYTKDFLQKRVDWLDQEINKW